MRRADVGRRTLAVDVELEGFASSRQLTTAAFEWLRPGASSFSTRWIFSEVPLFMSMDWTGFPHARSSTALVGERAATMQSDRELLIQTATAIAKRPQFSAPKCMERYEFCFKTATVPRMPSIR